MISSDILDLCHSGLDAARCMSLDISFLIRTSVLKPENSSCRRFARRVVVPGTTPDDKINFAKLCQMLGTRFALLKERIVYQVLTGKEDGDLLENIPMLELKSISLASAMHLMNFHYSRNAFGYVLCSYHDVFAFEKVINERTQPLRLIYSQRLEKGNAFLFISTGETDERPIELWASGIQANTVEMADGSDAIEIACEYSVKTHPHKDFYRLEIP